MQKKLLERSTDYSCPEEVLAKVAYSTYSALWYLKEAHNVIHRCGTVILFIFLTGGRGDYEQFIHDALV